MYLATALPSLASSPEWKRKIRRHQIRRPAGWRTEILNGRPIDRIIGSVRPHGILLDSLTLWVSARFQKSSVNELRDSLLNMIRDLRRRAPLVVVSDEVGLGVVPETSSGRRFLETLGRLNACLSEKADTVFFVVAGRPIRLSAARSARIEMPKVFPLSPRRGERVGVRGA